MEKHKVKHVQKKCCVPYCPTGDEKNFCLFSFPKYRYKQWEAAIQNVYPFFKYNYSLRICECHFSDRWFTSTENNKLSKFAVPDVLDVIVQIREYHPDGYLMNEGATVAESLKIQNKTDITDNELCKLEKGLKNNENNSVVTSHEVMQTNEDRKDNNDNTTNENKPGQIRITTEDEWKAFIDALTSGKDLTSGKGLPINMMREMNKAITRE